MKNKLKSILVLAALILAMIPVNSHGAVIKEDTIGEYVRQSEFVAYGELFISSISPDKVITGKLKVTEMFKGDLGEKEIDISIDMLDPRNYLKLKSDLTNLDISASEDIEKSGASTKQVIVMLNKERDGYDILRLITLFRPDKLDMYLYSYKEIISMTGITDKAKLLKTIRYNLGEEFSYSLYNYCIDELFKADIDYSELFSILKEFLDIKGKRKNYSWFTTVRRAGRRLEKRYDKTDEKSKDEYFGYLLASYENEPLESEYTQKQFLNVIYELRRLITKSEKWRKRFYDAISKRNVVIKGLSEDHFRNKELKALREKVMRSLNK